MADENRTAKPSKSFTPVLTYTDHSVTFTETDRATFLRRFNSPDQQENRDE